jgi:hypothetical protein
VKRMKLHKFILWAYLYYCKAYCHILDKSSICYEVYMLIKRLREEGMTFDEEFNYLIVHFFIHFDHESPRWTLFVFNSSFDMRVRMTVEFNFNLLLAPSNEELHKIKAQGKFPRFMNMIYCHDAYNVYGFVSCDSDNFECEVSEEYICKGRKSYTDVLMSCPTKKMIVAVYNNIIFEWEKIATRGGHICRD